MGTVKNFEELDIWKLSRIIVKEIYSDFSKRTDPGFKDQITRAGISVMNNISEGFCRTTDAEFRNFLNFAKGSAGELKNMYYIAEDLEFIKAEQAAERRETIQGLINGISKLMKYLKKPTT